MTDREKVIAELNRVADEANPWKESPPLRCDISYPLLIDTIALLKAQEPRVMTFEEVKEKIGSGECVFTECEKEGQWMRYGDAKLSVDQGNSCRIAFLISRRGDNPYVRWWMIYYENYNKTWRCWTSRPTDEQREAVKWVLPTTKRP